MKVELIGTTDDPLDTLPHHTKLKEEKFEIKVVPTFRPDKAMLVEDPKAFNDYTSKLEAISGVTISTYQDYIGALKKRHEHFALLDCKASDHGLEHLYAENFTEKKIEKIFSTIRSGEDLEIKEQLKFKSAILLDFAKWDHEKEWVQQFHLGALRNNNSRKMQQLGADSGWDSIGDFIQGKALVKFLNNLDKNNQLAKTILYNVNPADNELMATMIANFNDGDLTGKMQWGSAWWFLDQKDGMTNQLNILSNMGLLSRFVGMITDSRSFLSYPRHEYFRRILCNLFGNDIENGELPNDINWIGKIIQDICYYNAKKYFNW
jgi:glucuronate isomerase